MTDYPEFEQWEIDLIVSAVECGCPSDDENRRNIKQVIGKVKQLPVKPDNDGFNVEPGYYWVEWTSRFFTHRTVARVFLQHTRRFIDVLGEPDSLLLDSDFLAGKLKLLKRIPENTE